MKNYSGVNVLETELLDVFLMSGETHNYKDLTWRNDFGDQSFFWVSHNTYTERKKKSRFGKKLLLL